jgi:flagellar secretion chaperone FliS
MNAYFEQMILSASPIELVRLMYQRAIASVTDAREHLRAGRIRERADAIKKAYAIIAELMASLDAEKAPELVLNLRRLYCYMQERLLEANFRQKDAPLEETARLLNTLADAWREAPRTPGQTAPGAGKAVDGDHDDHMGAALCCDAVFA